MRSTFPVIAAIVLLAGCGTSQRVNAPRGAQEPESRPAQPRATLPPRRLDPAAPAVVGKGYPECDPRAGDPDRGRVAMGLLAGDCADDRGRNAVYVTRLVTVNGAASPAQRAGIQLGDRVVRVDACEIGSTRELAMLLRRAPPGWVARVVTERDGRSREAFVATVGLSVKDGGAPAATLSTAGCSSIRRPPAR